MGREYVFKSIKKSGRVCLIIGIIFMVFFGLMCFAMYADEGELITVILFAAFAILGLALVIYGLRTLLHPEKATCFKNNPQLLQMADQVYTHILYEDQFVLISDKVLANKKQPLQMTWLWDVYLIYLHTTSTNFIPTGSEYVIVSRNPKNQFTINVYAKGKKGKQNLLNILAQACPNARFGYSDEGFAYVEYMRKMDIQNIPNTPYYVGNQNVGSQNINSQNQVSQNIDNQNLDSQNMNSQNTGNQYVDGQNLDSQNIGNRNPQ